MVERFLKIIRNKYFLGVATLAVVTLFIFGAIIYTRLYRSNVDIKKDKLLFIPTGSDFNTVLDSIKKNSLVVDVESFVKASKSLGYIQRVKPGCYKIKTGMSNRTLIRMLITASQVPVRVTFNNIRTPEQLAGKVATQIEADSLSIIRYFKGQDIPQSYGFNEFTFISMFIPNTYEFYWNTNAKVFFDRMKKEHTLFWNKERIDKAQSIGL